MIPASLRNSVTSRWNRFARTSQPLLRTGLFIFATAPALADGNPDVQGDRVLPRSIHETEQRHWNARALAGWKPDPVQRKGAVPRPDVAAGPAREVHGYHPWWLGTSYQNYDWSLISTVAFFSLEMNASGAIINSHGWPWTDLVTAAHAGGARVIVTATLFSSSSIATLLADPSRRATAIANLTAAVTSGGADGVNIDFEGVPGNQKQNLVTFLNELKTALTAAVTNPYLSISTPAVDWNNAFDYDELAAACDHLMVMAYDYHWSGSSTTGPVAPLAGWGTYNVTWTINDYRTWGAPPAKILLGVPWYGYRWPAASSAAGAGTLSSATARTFSQAMSEVESHGGLWDAASSTPWTRWQEGNWLQTWFDDGQSTGLKYDLVMEEGLGGIGIWALGYDGSRPELRDALEAAFGTSSVSALPPGAGFVSTPFPNPVEGVARIGVSFEETELVRVQAFDAAGRLVDTILDGALSAGHHEIAWDTKELAPGLYFLSFETSRGVENRRVVISR